MVVVGGHAPVTDDIDGWLWVDARGSGKRGTGWSIRAVAADDIESVAVDPRGATWLATDAGRFSIVDGAPHGDVRVVERAGPPGRHAMDDGYIYWTEGARIGRVARTACH